MMGTYFTFQSSVMGKTSTLLITFICLSIPSLALAQIGAKQLEGASSGSTQATDAGLLASTANSIASENLIDSAISNGTRALSTLNIPLGVQAIREGLRGIDADDQSKDQAQRTMEALTGEMNATKKGSNPQLEAKRRALQSIIDDVNPKREQFDALLAKFDARIDSKNKKIITTNHEFPLSMTDAQLNSLLTSLSNQKMEQIINSVAEKALGIKNLISVPDIITKKIKGTIIAGIDRSKLTIDAIGQQAILEAKKQLAAQNLLQGGDISTISIGSAPLQDMDKSVNNGAAGKSRGSKSLKKGKIPSYRATSSLEKMGHIHDDIFEMVSRKYKELMVLDRVIINPIIYYDQPRVE